jgi:two-component system response regulator LytT
MIGNLGPDIRIVAVLDSVKKAIDFFRRCETVDLVFADIQLGDGLSFEIFRSARVGAPIIFCTAYDEYALEAIQSNGIEYILKPFTREDIAAAIDKYQRLKRHFVPREIDYDKIIQAITGDKPVPEKLQSILVYHRDKVIPVAIGQVALFYIHNDLTHLHCLDGRSFIVNQSLDELEELIGSAFFRVNRQYLVSRGAIKDANHYMPRKYVVNLSIHFKEALVVSKNRTADFLEWLTRK